MQAGQEKFGMQTMNQALLRLVERRLITPDSALATSSNRDELVMMMQRAASPSAVAAGTMAARTTPLRQEAR